jgi:hypothetical protein
MNQKIPKLLIFKCKIAAAKVVCFWKLCKFFISAD